MINDPSLGRSFGEALRMLDALQHTKKHGDICPVDQRHGDAAMKPTTEGVAEYLVRHSAS